MIENVHRKIKAFYERHSIKVNIILILISILLPYIINSNYIVGILCRVLMYSVLAGSLNIINGYSGQFNIGHAGFFCIGAYTEAVLATRYGWNFWLLLLIAGIFTSLVGFLISLPTLRLRGIYLAIVTLGFSEIIRIIALNWTSVTGGPMGVKGIPSPIFLGIRISGSSRYYYIFLALAILFIFITNRVITSRIGRAWISIREDELAAKSLGVESSFYKSINFMYGAFWAGVMGAAYAPYYKFIASDMFTLDEGFNILSMVIIGGQGTLVGPFVGSLIVNIITEVFRFAAQYRMVVYAILIITMMWLRPQGLVGAYDSILAGNRARRKLKRKPVKVGDK
ncbi:branched-chain amino acid ABC transporter permease [Serpentinicella alkaliphila]|uniref:Amino acid/amide ABC transporter membrane protein 2 (HAAT family) n=1 Tax=Serpentinicella alkaliphila TaxID=1734049 RepID=A0A4R2TJ19_9FIRM|nr:branched-chain amino acid ABC transporter permease [Serpentinicella alkaliphila]QUH26446.1 branched-chain amino acid ABC transporter permease [Serpentinicella alkaliphila]TCQ03281.1 amino acid/amide ABC transporter membrane protein 2 (HAAT family) [Serpentinicella alkaliphila]